MSVKPVSSSVPVLGNCTSNHKCPPICIDCECRYLLEHGLEPDGRPNGEISKDAGAFETFFTETGKGKYVPRALFVDLDPSVSNS